MNLKEGLHRLPFCQHADVQGCTRARQTQALAAHPVPPSWMSLWAQAETLLWRWPERHGKVHNRSFRYHIATPIQEIHLQIFVAANPCLRLQTCNLKRQLYFCRWIGIKRRRRRGEVLHLQNQLCIDKPASSFVCCCCCFFSSVFGLLLLFFAATNITSCKK